MPEGSLSSTAWNNWYRKHIYELTDRWVRELPRQHASDAKFQRLWPPLEARLKEVRAEDDSYWHGWFARNHGVVEYLGDRVAGPDGMGTNVVTGVLLALFVGLMGALLRQAAR